jgi:hypothetical protein
MPNNNIDTLVDGLIAKVLGVTILKHPAQAIIEGLDRGANIAEKVYLADKFGDLDSEDARASLADFKVRCLAVYTAERGPRAATLLSPVFGTDNSDFVEKLHYQGVVNGIKSVWAGRVYVRPTTE